MWRENLIALPSRGAQSIFNPSALTTGVQSATSAASERPPPCQEEVAACPPMGGRRGRRRRPAETEQPGGSTATDRLAPMRCATREAAQRPLPDAEIVFGGEVSWRSYPEMRATSWLFHPNVRRLDDRPPLLNLGLVKRR